MSSLATLATLEASRLIQYGNELFARRNWERERLLAHQHEQLVLMLRHAIDASPFYGKTISELVLRNAPLHEFPILTKQILMANFDQIVTDPRLDRRLVEHHLDSDNPGDLLLGEYRVAATGGTTGVKGLAVFDSSAWLAAIGNTLRFQRFVGIDEATQSMGIFASSPVHISYRIGTEMRAIRSPAPRLNVLMPIEAVVEGLNAYQPEVVSTYPSFVRVLANEQLAGRLHIRPRLIRTSAETLTPKVREIAADAWGAKVANSYTCTEAGAMGHECECVDGLHLAEDAFVFEVVDDNDRPVPNGTPGAKLLVTTLTNRVLPLVRYEISDIVTLATEPCRCGLPFWRIANIEGRREEMLRFAKRGGGTVDVHGHRLRSPLTSIEGISQYQFGQLPDGVEVTISLLPGFDAELVSHKLEFALRAALAKIDAEPAQILIRVVDAIMRSGSGAKQRLVVSPTSG
ncbi:phenylacetate--CoA ligase family protein [Rhizobium cremeum]|uniref:phenylacetate--CoA ligase family protein n=1 Tax=Rhizobium cremeum TaxID=2813827 RepID=UPI001FD62620|nr:phenylacetate--CoA ligase family protein [Rhizobium cremeum]